MGAAMHVGIVCGVIVLKGLQHLARLLAGGGVIEVDQGPTVGSDLLKDREVGTISI